eukprot:CAMPEP_0179093434 /NCGR_PEP_ID=MMETSP0796-20121207/42790_1 /TAXON_ID=73915 /ORGANISM="Pyrodinium bahamense, Strain pbaha01" /LENGTH=226 /DNA_ID=CAMNT_0020791069 /DNA_START=84 /DNA_END=761 /DNA_ORIENTATION=-
MLQGRMVPAAEAIPVSDLPWARPQHLPGPGAELTPLLRQRHLQAQDVLHNIVISKVWLVIHILRREGACGVVVRAPHCTALGCLHNDICNDNHVTVQRLLCSPYSAVQLSLFLPHDELVAEAADDIDGAPMQGPGTGHTKDDENTFDPRLMYACYLPPPGGPCLCECFNHVLKPLAQRGLHSCGLSRPPAPLTLLAREALGEELQAVWRSACHVTFQVVETACSAD